MNIKRERNYVLFIIPFMLYFIPKYLEYTTFMAFSYVAQLCSILKTFAYFSALFLWLIKSMYYRKVTKRVLFFIVICLIYLSFMAFVNDRKALFVVVLLSLLYEERFKRFFLRDVFAISLVMYIFVIAMAILHIIPNELVVMNKYGISFSRLPLGFNYAGQLTMMFTPLLFMYFYIKGARITFIDNFIWSLATFFVFAVSQTIMGTFINVIFIVMFNAVKNKKFLHRVKEAIVYVPWFFAILTAILLFLYSRNISLVKKLDVLVNGRINLGVEMSSIYGIRLLGTTFENNTIDFYQYLDSEYMHMFVGEGILFTIFALIVGCYIIRYCLYKGDRFALLIWIMVFFNAMFNNGIYNLVMNPFGIVVVEAIRYNLSNNNFGNKVLRFRINYD